MAFRVTVYGVPVVVHTNVAPVRWLGKRGLTLGHHILLACPASEVWPALLAHESFHVFQWDRLGVLGFIGQYVLGLLLYGYGLKHPMEREAHDYDAAHQADPVYVDAVWSIGGRA